MSEDKTMKKRKIWTALNQAAPYIRNMSITLGMCYSVFFGHIGGIKIAEYMQLPAWVIATFGVVGGIIGGALPPGVYWSAKWWQRLEPTEPPEFLRRRAARHDEKSGAISEAPSTGGEISEVER